jgi:type II secretory pathway component PulF
VSTGSAGFGVEAGQLQQVARQYDGAGADIVAVAGSVVTNVGEGQVGRRFAAVAARYRQAFDQLGRNLTAFGEQATGISVRLNEIATAYASAEEARARSIEAVR